MLSHRGFFIPSLTERLDLEIGHLRAFAELGDEPIRLAAATGPSFGAVVGILVFGHAGRFAFCSAATTEQFADGEAGIFGESSDLVLEFGTLALFSNAESFLDFKVQFHQVFE